MTPQETTVQTVLPVMAKNNLVAAENRRRLDALGLFTVNLMSSPGSGKTSLLEALAGRLGAALVVIEGDVQTRRDTERLERVGCRAYQIETHGACHLDAAAVSRALDALNLARGEHQVLVIENVGNLICPGGYDLGEHLRMALLSVAEGDDKVLKYPSLFSRISALAISKVDLLPHLDFDIERAFRECRSLVADLDTLTVSAKTGEGIDALADFLLRSAKEHVAGERELRSTAG